MLIHAFLLPLIISVAPGKAKSAADESPVYPVASVQPGQKAYGLTVFVGDKVERFDLVLLGVLSNFLGPKKDLVIGRLTDPKLEMAGVVAGMSGSPIYVDGKLLGALGYAMGGFMKEGICGITPIGDMREVRDLPVIDPFKLTGPYAQGFSEMLPIAAPLSVSGVDPTVFAHFAPTFEKMGFVATPGGGGNGKAASSGKLVAGGAVSAQLVRGDLSIAATGTVTSVDGNKVLAFGHPFMGGGFTSFPMASVNIITIVPSLQRSFKMGEVLEEIGTFTQDRLTAIAGDLGQKPSVVPVTVEVQSDPENKKYLYHYELARDPKLTPELVNLVVSNSLTRRIDAATVGTIIIEGEMVLNNDRKVKLSSLVAMERDQLLPLVASMSVARPVDILWRNDFGPPMVKRVDIRAKLLHDIRRQHIEFISVQKAPFRPGDRVVVSIGLKPDEQPLITTTMDFMLPLSLSSGEYELFIGGANEANAVEQKALGSMRPQSGPALVDALESIRPDGPMFLQLLGKGGSLRMGDALLTDVPLSFSSQVAAPDTDTRMQKTAYSLVLEQKKATGAYVFGDGRATIRVRSK